MSTRTRTVQRREDAHDIYQRYASEGALGSDTPGSPPGTPALGATGHHQDPVGAISEYDARVRRELVRGARQALGNILAAVSVGEAFASLPEQELCAFREEMRCGEALQAMAERGHHTCPVVGEDGVYR